MSLSISKVLGEDGLKTLQNAAIDKGQAFLSNKVTSSFVKVAQNDTVSTLTNVAATGLGTVATIKSITNKEALKEVTVLMTQLIQAAISEITQETAKMVGEYTSKHLTAIAQLPTTTAKYTMSTFNANKMSVGDIIKQIKEKADELSEKQNKENTEQQTKNAIVNQKKKMNKIIKDVNAYIKIGMGHIESINSYISEGPQWVEDQLNKQINSVISHTKNILDKQWNEHDAKMYDDLAHNIGDPAGEAMAEKYNSTLRKAQNKIIAKMETQMKKGKTKVKTGAMGAILKLAAKTGVL